MYVAGASLLTFIKIYIGGDGMYITVAGLPMYACKLSMKRDIMRDDINLTYFNFSNCLLQSNFNTS